MTIHSDHPFADPVPDPLRQFRGRMPAPVTVWTTGQGASRAGWTVSSLMICDGEPGLVLGLIDEDSEFHDEVSTTDCARFVVNLLGSAHGFLAEAFAGLAPSPGGPFRLGEWETTDHGPVLSDCVGWIGARLDGPPVRTGWRLLVRGEIEHVEIGDADALTHVRGRYTTK